MNIIQQKIESLLFFKNEPISYIWIARQLNLSVSNIINEVSNMQPFYENRGISLISTDTSIVLMTADISADIISGLTKKDEEKELSKQALETLAIILYKEHITKSEIDYIRGVNSVFILRNLLIRGLIEKNENKADKRSPVYSCTADMLSYLNITSLSELPNLQAYKEKLGALEQQYISENTDSEVK